MPRLFIAVALPGAVKTSLLSLRKPLPGLRWTAPENLHLTLRFIGEVSDSGAGRIRAALGQVAAEPFLVQVAGLGKFVRTGRAIFWAGLQASPALAGLRRQVDAALAAGAGVAPESGEYSPHITLARMQLPEADGLGRLLAENSARVDLEIIVRSFTLFRSVLLPDGPEHCPVQTYRLVRGKAAASADFPTGKIGAKS